LAVAEAFQASGILLLQGYGLTESSPVISFNRKGRYKHGTVGPPLPGVEVRIGDDGEVLSRGPHIMKGYWKNPQATAETVRDGWLHTGDLGELDADGFLKITGRKKELLVLSNGKKVAPNQVEGLLLADTCIDQVVICGEGRNYLTALIVPNLANVRKELGASCPGGADEVFCRHPQVIAFFEKRMEPLLADVSLAERVKRFVLLPQQFSVAGDELTVSLKLRRNVIAGKYRELIEELYR
jgi:long-chain acyl-CoA synthetase